MAYGLEFSSLVDEGTAGQWIRKIGEALEYIDKHDARLRRSIAMRFLLVRAGGEVYDPSAKCYVIDLGTLQARTVPEVALGIVHEATHARLLRRFGIRHQLRHLERVEHICIRQEVEFAKKTGRTDILEIASSKSQQKWWTKEELVRRRRARGQSIK